MELTLAVLEKDAPELLKEIQGIACAEGWAAGKKEGEQLERERVLEILQEDGDPAIALQAIKDGLAAAAAIKLFYQALKAKQGQALADLETSAPVSLGQTEPAVPAASANPEMELDAKARERAKEKNIGLDAAMLEVAAENPELLARWNPAAGLNF